MISKAVSNLLESSTLKLNAKVNQLKASGVKVFNLTAGEPDFPPPEESKLAVEEALKQNLSKYTPTPGLPVLREKIALRMQKQHSKVQTPWTKNHVVVSNGGKQAIFNSVFTLIDAGDEVIIPAPYWLSYPEMVKAAQGVSRIVLCPQSQDYKITPAQLDSAITDRSRLFILNSPSNPTGAMYTRGELEKLGEVLRKHKQVWILSDEIYDTIYFTDSPWVSFLEANPDLQSRTITVNGLSKSGAMTGWRIGWSVSPENFAQALICLQGHSTSGICSLSQYAAIAALDLPEEYFAQHRRQYLNRRDLSLKILSQSAKLKVSVPDGAFYLFIDVTGCLSEKESADEFAESLLEKKGVAVVPARDFGMPNAIRVSFAVDELTLQSALQLLVDFSK